MVVQAEEQAEVTKVINLTPIPKQIQERLREKMSVIGRERQISPNQQVDTNGLKLEAAKLLGWGRNTLARKVKDFN